MITTDLPIPEPPGDDRPGDDLENARDWFTLSDMADYLQVAMSTLYKWRAAGGDSFPYCVVLPNGQIRVHKDDIQLWLHRRAHRGRW